MRVLVLGAYGLIGGYVLPELAAAGHETIGAGRRIAEASRRFPYARWIKLDFAKASIEEWRGYLDGADAVVNCVGALQDGPSDNLQDLHVAGLARLATAIQEQEGKRLVHISAVGISTSPKAFGRTKLEGERVLRTQDFNWVILRPGLVIAPAAFGGSALLRGLAAFPFFIPAIYPNAPIQVVSAQDVGRAVVAALRDESPTRVVVDLVASPTYSLGEILVALRAWLGLPAASVVRLPVWLAGFTARVADVIGWLGWRSPMRTTAVSQLAHGVQGGPHSRQLPGLRLQTLEELLAAMPSGVQERWFARAYFCKPLALITLALFWIASGAVGLARVDAASALLSAAGVLPAAAKTTAVVGGVADILLGLGVCVRRWSPYALRGMVLLSMSYLIGATLMRPDLWTDPLGPLVKVIPTIVLALVVLALMDER